MQNSWRRLQLRQWHWWLGRLNHVTSLGEHSMFSCTSARAAKFESKLDWIYMQTTMNFQMQVIDLHSLVLTIIRLFKNFGCGFKFTNAKFTSEGLLKAPRLVNPHPLGASFHHVSSSSCSLALPALPSLGPPSGAWLKGHPPLEFVAPGVTPWALYPARKESPCKDFKDKLQLPNKLNYSIKVQLQHSEPGAKASTVWTWDEMAWMTMMTMMIDNDWQWD